MNQVQIAQEFLDRATTLTPPPRLSELRGCFSASGVKLVPDGSRVVAVVDGAFTTLYAKLGAFPVVKIAAKRIIGRNVRL